VLVAESNHGPVGTGTQSPDREIDCLHPASKLIECGALLVLPLYAVTECF